MYWMLEIERYRALGWLCAELFLRLIVLAESLGWDSVERLMRQVGSMQFEGEK
jgi:hypothetical protein